MIVRDSEHCTKLPTQLPLIPHAHNRMIYLASAYIAKLCKIFNNLPIKKHALGTMELYQVIVTFLKIVYAYPQCLSIRTNLLSQAQINILTE